MDLIKTLMKGKGSRIALLILIFTIGIVLILASGRGEDIKTGEKSLEEYKAELEAELAELCSSVKGVGKCRVSVSFSRGAENTYKGSVLIETRPPEVLGVIIVCRGADSDSVRRDLTELVTSLFGIASNRVAILKLS